MNDVELDDGTTDQDPTRNHREFLFFRERILVC